jgi:hypothetical protein
MKGIVKIPILSLFFVLLFSNTVVANHADIISEPATMALVGIGLLGIAGFSKKLFQK